MSLLPLVLVSALLLLLPNGVQGSEEAPPSLELDLEKCFLVIRKNASREDEAARGELEEILLAHPDRVRLFASLGRHFLPGMDWFVSNKGPLGNLYLRSVLFSAASNEDFRSQLMKELLRVGLDDYWGIVLFLKLGPDESASLLASERDHDRASAIVLSVAGRIWCRPAKILKKYAEACIRELEDSPTVIGEKWIRFFLSEILPSVEGKGDTPSAPASLPERSARLAHDDLDTLFSSSMTVLQVLWEVPRRPIRQEGEWKNFESCVELQEDVLEALLARLEKILEDNPHFLHALGARAVALEELGRYVEADACFDALAERVGKGSLYGWFRVLARRNQILFQPRCFEHLREARQGGLRGSGFEEIASETYLGYLLRGEVAPAQALFHEIEWFLQVFILVVSSGFMAISLVILGILVLKAPRSGPFEPTWPLAVGLSVVFVVAQVPMMFTLGIWMGLLSAGSLVLLGYGLICRRSSGDQAGFRWPGWWKGLVIPILAAMATVALAMGTGLLYSALGIEMKSQLGGDLIGVASGVNRILVLVAVVIVIPAAEEVLFRRLWFQNFQKIWGFWIAAGASAAVFAGIHLEPAFFIQLALVGLVFAWVYHRTQSTLSATIAHGLNNLAAVLVIWLT